ncbi:MAG TPA: glycosyltransferase family 39 protein, partial [Candidatus Acidoferrales bacterium]|nr:glycosyltransferase family 39 protein [Candidatus Acidoferrales bacterium]
PDPQPPLPALLRTIAAATLVAAALRLFRLGHQSLWVDEVFTWASAGGGSHLGLRDLLENVHGPLYGLALHLWMGVAGESEWALRFPSAIAGILTVPALAWLAARWLGREAVAPAVWLAAGSPFLVWYSQETRNYAWLILASTLSTAALLELERRFTARRVLGYAAAAAFGLLSNFAFALLAPLHARRWFAGAPETRRARGLVAVAVGAVILALALPWVPQVLRTWDWSRLVHRHEATTGEAGLRGANNINAAAFPFALHAFAVGYTLGPSLRELRAHTGAGTLRRHLPELVATAATFGVLGIAGLAALARRRRLIDAALWVLVPALAVGWFAERDFKVFHPRYLAVALPCVLLVMAAAFADAPPRLRVALGLAVAALWGVSLAHHYFAPAYGREDYRDAVAIVRTGRAPGEQVLAVGSPEPVEFYGRDLGVQRFWLGFAATPARLDQRLRATLDRAPGAWVVLSRSEDDDPRGRFAQRLAAWYPRAATWSLPGVRVWHLVGAPHEAPAGDPPAVAR